METRRTFSLFAGLAFAIASVPGFAAPQPDTNQDAAPSVASATAPAPADAKQGDFEELTQGPVHEAFAEPVVFDPEPGIVVADAPPDPIKEVQPQEKPEGADVVWIGGYWGWDAEKKDFLWVSGIWRVQPPDRKWKPGYFNKVDGGYQWVSGFWEPTQSDARSVKAKLPKPPKSLERGPSSPQPDDQHVWIPGYWDYSGSDYAWSTGYWTPGYPDRVYIPAHYVWYPDGYVWVGGYWDYPVAFRGFLFAPVHFRSPVYASVGFSFTPGLVINTGFFLDNVFVYPSYGHYYFGNYYDPACIGFGIYPAYSPVFLAIGFSGIWEHHVWDRHHRHGNDWDRNKYRDFRDAYQHERQERFERLRANVAERPARTFQKNASRISSATKGERDELAARQFKDVLADKAFVGGFVKQSKQSVASARQATIAERKNLRTAVQQRGILQENAPKPGQSAREKAVITDKNRPGGEKATERKQPVRGTDKSDLDQKLLRKNSDPPSTVNSDKTPDTENDSQGRETLQPAKDPSSTRRINEKRSEGTRNNAPSKDEKKSGNERRGDR